MEPSAAASTVVPNSSTPSVFASRRITCTRWPAMSMSQSALSTEGANSRSVSTRSASDSSSSPIRYFSSGISVSPTPIIDARLFGLTDSGRSVTLPALRNFGDQPANGPNSSQSCPLITRVSRCGIDIGGAPSGGSPYTLAWWPPVSSGLLVRSNSPLTGKPPKPLASVMPDFCSSGSAPPPAPTNTNLALQLALLAGAAVDDLHRPAAVGLLVADRAPRGRTAWSCRVRRRSRAAAWTATRSRRRCRPGSSSARPGSVKSRPAAISGSRRANSSASSMNSIDGEQRVARPACRGGGAGSRRSRRRARS